MKKALFLIAFFFLFASLNVFAQGPQLSVVSSDVVCPASGCRPIASSVSITAGAGTTIDGLSVYFYSGYNPNQDSLTFTPMFGITGNWNSSTGVLTLNGVATPAQYELIIQSISYCSKILPASSGTRSLYIVLGALLYNPVNNHYYKKVSLPTFNYVTWHDAEAAASASTYLGMQGYLINLTSVQENNFISQLVNSNTWIGASDELVENEWRWVSGCEGLENGGTGRLFSNQQNFNCGQSGFGTGTPVGGNYINWSFGEPNGCNNGAESYAHLFSTGQWNDYEDSGFVSAYIIEYGCMPNDPIVQTFDNINLYINDSIASPSIASNLPVCDGTTVNLTASGIYSSNVSFSWSGPLGYSANTSQASIAAISQAKNGVYTITVSDSGCFASKSFTINQPIPVSSSLINKNDALCFNSNSGSINQIGLNGHPNFTYLWSNGQTTASINNILAGTYIVTVTDAAGCTGTASYTIGEPTLLSSNIVSTVDVSCNGNDGSASSNASGGVPPYNYLWSNGSNAAICTGLSTGPFTLTVTDANGCSSISSGTLGVIPPLNLITVNNPSICIGQTASLSVITNGGEPPYQYSWTNGAISSSINVSPTTNQNYTVTVTDNNNCTANYTYLVSVNPPLSSSVSNNASVCPGSPVNLSVTASGGNGTYSYLWSNGSITNTQTVSPVISTTYYITITDNCGTPPKLDSIEVTTFDSPIINITPSLNSGCAPLTVTFNNNSPALVGATYNWDLGNGTFSSIINPMVTYSDTGKYNISLSITSVNGCTTADTIFNAISSYFVPIVDFNYSPDNGCMPLEVAFTDNSQTVAGSVYNWNFGNGTFSNAVNPVVTYPDSGKYTVSLAITTPQGCTGKDTVINAITVYSTPEAEFSYAPLTPTILFNNIDFEDKSSGLINQWSWTFGDSLGLAFVNNPSFSFNEAGEYDITLIVSNQYQCGDTIVKTISVKNDYSFFIPKAFTPNDDGVNDVLEMYGFNYMNFDFKIYNRHGQLVNEATDNPLWNGRDSEGKLLPPGVYVYTVKLREAVNNKRHEYQGTVTLIR